MKRKLYARFAADGGKEKSHKTPFCRVHGISARMFNAITIELQGLIDDARELLKKERSGRKRSTVIVLHPMVSSVPVVSVT